MRPHRAANSSCCSGVMSWSRKRARGARGTPRAPSSNVSSSSVPTIDAVTVAPSAGSRRSICSRRGGHGGLLLATGYETGRPRPRWAMTSRWISFDPTLIVGWRRSTTLVGETAVERRVGIGRARTADRSASPRGPSSATPADAMRCSSSVTNTLLVDGGDGGVEALRPGRRSPALRAGGRSRRRSRAGPGCRASHVRRCRRVAGGGGEEVGEALLGPAHPEEAGALVGERGGHLRESAARLAQHGRRAARARRRTRCRSASSRSRSGRAAR